MGDVRRSARVVQNRRSTLDMLGENTNDDDHIDDSQLNNHDTSDASSTGLEPQDEFAQQNTSRYNNHVKGSCSFIH